MLLLIALIAWIAMHAGRKELVDKEMAIMPPSPPKSDYGLLPNNATNYVLHANLHSPRDVYDDLRPGEI